MSEILRRHHHSISALTVALVAGDVLVMIAVTVAEHAEELLPLVLVCVALLLCRAAGRIYRPRLRLAYLDDLPRIVVAAAASLLLTAGLFELGGEGAATIADTTRAVITVALLAEVPRAVLLTAAGAVRRRFGRGERTLVIADQPLGDDLVTTMAGHPEFGLRAIGRLDGEVTSDQLADAVRQVDAHTVVIATPRSDRESVDTVIAAHRAGCQVLVLPALFELFDDRPYVERLRSFPLIRMSGDPMRRTSWQIKRLLDVVVASVSLVVLAPLLAVLALLVLVSLGRPVLFVQQRVGRGGAPFPMMKFRTLPVAEEQVSSTTWSVAADRRPNRVGRLLRAASLDELPQLLNVLHGEMSLVGPRPERPVFVERFAALHDGYGARHRVPAGLTGLAQISGLRGDTSITDRARYDNYYIANWSLWLDLRIVLLTVGEIARHAWASGRWRPTPPAPRALR